MTPPRRRVAGRLYRLMLLLLPRATRADFGREMEDTFLALLDWEGRRRGWVGRTYAWLQGGWDVVSAGLGHRLRPGGQGAGPNRSEHSQGPIRGGGEMLGNWIGDSRVIVRSLVRKPLYTLTVIITLGVGIGANSSVFTLVDGLLLEPLPYEDPEELIALWEENPVRGWSRVNVSPVSTQDWSERSRALEAVGTSYYQDLTYLSDGQPRLLPVVRVSANMFEMLGREPVLGRSFSEEEMGVGRDGVTILTHGFWRSEFGGDPEILGRSLDIQGRQRTVIGVLPESFKYLDEEPVLFLPLDLIPSDHSRSDKFLKAMARLHDGVTVEEARADLEQVSLQLQEDYPETNENWRAQVVTARDEMLGPSAKPASLALMVAVGFILLMACVNVANLALARGEHRARELAVRSALGAGRGRIIRQLLLESLILAGLGGSLGLLLATWGYRGVVATLPNHTAPLFEFGMDLTVLLFTVGATVASALLFGTVPALRFSRFGTDALRDGGRGGRSASAARFGSGLVVLQTALALVLLIGGGLLLKQVSGMRNQDLGFNPENAFTVRIRPPASEYPEEADLATFWATIEDRVAEAPGVRAVGSTQSHPLSGETWLRTLQIVGQEQEREVRFTYASGGLFDALSFTTIQGRPLQHQDDDAPSWAAVVNESFVDAYLESGADPLGVSFQNAFDSLPPVPIVGVIQDVVEGNIDQEPGPALYLSFSQAPIRRRSLVVRTAGPPLDFLPGIKEAIWSVDPKLPLDRIETLEHQVAGHVGGFAVVANLMAVFAFLSLFLGALGIYGVTAYAASRRTQEIGIRMALGARPGDVVRMVVGQGGKRAAIGLVLGLLLAFSLGRVMGSMFLGVESGDPTVIVPVTMVLAFVSFLALWIPARRASSVGPVEALDQE